MDMSPDMKQLVQRALDEDLSDRGDITSDATIDKNQTIKAIMAARQEGTIVGIDLAAFVFSTVDKTLKITRHINDGHAVKQDQPLLTIEGNAQSILMAERVALNFLSHLSGIATETAQYVAAVKGTKAKILDTRKTLPGYRALQKYAVKMGGGTNHRFGLHDMILIKDNHIATAGSIKNALNAAQNSGADVKIEIEVDTIEQLQEVLDHGGADIVMLDNMAPDLLQTAVALTNGKVLLEASGGVNLDTVQTIAKTGVDYISVGALTHSVTALDIGLDIL